VGATGINNFETYLFRHGPFEDRHSLLLGCLARFAPVPVQIFTHYGGRRIAQDVILAPKCHIEVPLAAEHEGERLARVEVKSLFRLLSYVVGRRDGHGRSRALRPSFHLREMTPVDTEPELKDDLLLCYCTMLTVGQLRAGVHGGTVAAPREGEYRQALHGLRR
jgi:hypothetical protein